MSLLCIVYLCTRSRAPEASRSHGLLCWEWEPRDRPKSVGLQRWAAKLAARVHLTLLYEPRGVPATPAAVRPRVNISSGVLRGRPSHERVWLPEGSHRGPMRGSILNTSDSVSITPCSFLKSWQIKSKTTWLKLHVRSRKHLSTLKCETANLVLIWQRMCARAKFNYWRPIDWA